MNAGVEIITKRKLPLLGISPSTSCYVITH